jgi:hypothetical protein
MVIKSGNMSKVQNKKWNCARPSQSLRTPLRRTLEKGACEARKRVNRTTTAGASTAIFNAAVLLNLSDSVYKTRRKFIWLPIVFRLKER